MSQPPPWNDGPGVPVGGHPGGVPEGGVPPYHPDGMSHRAAPPPYPGPAPAPGPFPYAGPTPAAPHAAPAAGQADAPMAPAPWGLRVAARLIDWLLLLVPAALVAALVAAAWVGIQALSGQASGVAGHFTNIFSVVYFLILTVYDSVAVTKWRRTLGKRLIGLAVAPADGGGRQGPIPVASVVARSAVLNVANLAVALDFWVEMLMLSAAVVAIVLWPLWDARGQGLHDKVARTVVLRPA